MSVNSPPLLVSRSAPKLVYTWERPVPMGGLNIQETNEVGVAGEPYRGHVDAGEPDACTFHGLRSPGSGCDCFYDWADSGTCKERRDWAATAPCLGGPCANCTLGVCHSPPPAAVSARLRPAVYVYDLPLGFNQLRPRIALGRNTPYMFWQRLSRSGYLTTNASEADYFFVPVSAMGSISHGVILLALRYVAETWPFFNASRGRDHLVIAPWDFGAAWVSGYPGVERVRFMSHWGLTEKDARYANGPVCTLCGPSYVPGKDFVVPDMLESSFAHAPASGVDRNILVYFSGGPTCRLREQLLALGAELAARSDVVIVHAAGRDMGHDMDASRFCLAPPGAGYGTRASLAVTRGCIPVLIGDNIAPVYDGYIDWRTYALRVAEANISRVVEIIEAVPPEQEARLREAGVALKTAFRWSTGEDEPGDAFHTTMAYLLKHKDWGLP